MSASVFKVERGLGGEKLAYLRMFSGTIRTRDRRRFHRGGEPDVIRHNGEKVTAIHVFERGSASPRASVGAGQIGKLWGLGDVRIGDTVGPPRTAAEYHFAPPTLEAAVVPRRPPDKGALHVALAQLAEQDPLINLRQDDARQELFVSLYGEVQKQVIQATLANEYHLEVEFRDTTTTICVERPIGTGTAVEILGRTPNPFRATVGLRVEPAPLGSGVHVRFEAALGTIPLFIYKSVGEFREAIANAVRDTLRQGLYGWQVTDCTVVMTQSGYTAPTSTAADFRKLTPLVLMSALRQAGTVVCEPIHRFRLEGPLDTLGATLPALARLGALPLSQEQRGSAYVLDGEVPAARLHELQQQVPKWTRDEGVLEYAFDRYEPVRGVPETASGVQGPVSTEARARARGVARSGRER